MAANQRQRIPIDIANEVLISNDNTCCVCMDSSKKVQIHHLDGNNKNNTFPNLAVLCFDCHDKTQITGGFARGLTPSLVSSFKQRMEDMISKRNEYFVQKIPNTEDVYTSIDIAFEMPHIFGVNESLDTGYALADITRKEQWQITDGAPFIFNNKESLALHYNAFVERYHIPTRKVEPLFKERLSRLECLHDLLKSQTCKFYLIVYETNYKPSEREYLKSAISLLSDYDQCFDILIINNGYFPLLLTLCKDYAMIMHSTFKTFSVDHIDTLIKNGKVTNSFIENYARKLFIKYSSDKGLRTQLERVETAIRYYQQKLIAIT